MSIVVYFVAVAWLMAVAFVVFRVFVRRDYKQKVWLTWRSSLLELMVTTEEEHLLTLHGEEYARHCQRVPPYVRLWWTRQEAAV